MPEAALIVPPPEIRKIIEKMVDYVSEHGTEFEQKVLEREGNNPKFSFIRPIDPYHAFYQQQIQQKKFGSGNAIDSDHQMEDIKPVIAQVEEQPPANEVEKRQDERKSFLEKLRSGVSITATTEPDEVPAEPPRFRFLLDIPFTQISAQDLDIIKLTAQFAAKNGDHFRSNLLSKEGSNPQFDFLKANHTANPLYNALVESYSSIMRPPRDVIEQLSSGKSRPQILDSILKRAEWERFQTQNTKELEDAEKEEREARAMIDWHSFIIVETIDFHEGEDLAEPQDFSKLGENGITQTEIDMDDNDDMDMDIEMDTAEATVMPANMNLRIRKDYKPSAPKPPVQKVAYQKCPVCSHEIPVDELDEHVRIELLDPRFSEQRASLNRKQKTSSLVSGQDIVKNLQGLKPHRSDIWGDQESLQIGSSDKSKNEKNIWDGHSGSARHVSSAALSGMTVEEQIEAIHEAKGIRPRYDPESHSSTQPPPPQPYSLPDGQPRPPVPGYPGMGMPIPPPGYPGMGIPGILPPLPTTNPPAPLEEPPAKKAKLEEWTDSLMPESEWVDLHPGVVVLKVATPDYPNKNGWKLDGSSVEVGMALSESVQKLKEELSRKLGMPVNKQNIRLDVHFLKDKDSLAFYNLDTSSDISLGVKERGKRGRK